jgi:dipeptidyl aminopeptidase/acylaminoacyl peptidase
MIPKNLIFWPCWLMAAALAACSGSAQTQEPAGPGAPAAIPAGHDATPLIPRAMLFGNPSRTRPELSPDGTRIAYIAPHEGVLNVWVRTLGNDEGDDEGDDEVITNDRVRGIRVYHWAPSGTHILYLQDQGGDENFHVYAVPAGGGEAVDLTPLDGVMAQIIAVEPERPGTILVGLNDRDRSLHDVYEIDIETGKRTLVQPNDLGAIQWIADHTLAVRGAVVPTAEGGMKLMHRDASPAKEQARAGRGAAKRARGAADRTPPWKELHVWSAEDSFTSGALAFAGDNRLLYVRSSQGSETVELRAMDTTTGKESTVAADATADMSQLAIHPTTHQVQAVAFTRARTEWKLLDESISQDFVALSAVHAGDFSIVSRDHADAQWLVRYEHDKGAPRYYAYDRARKQATFLFSTLPELDDQPLAAMKPVTYEARDGLTIHGYLTTPVGVEARNLPAVVLPHGGPWHRDTWGFSPLVQLLANRGYAVLQPNFRGSTGYGKAFLNAADREWGGTMQDDITDGTRWLIEQGLVDPGRICIMGGSYGGYATLMGLAREPELYACGVNIVGVANLITWLKTIPPYWIPFKHILHRRVGNPDTEAEFLKSRSPVFLVDRIKAPLLIGQGANDPRVPRAESIQIRDALESAGRRVEYMEFADEGHGFVRPENRLAFFARAEKFLAETIGGRLEN